MRKKDFIPFVLTIAIYGFSSIGVIMFTNVTVDAASVIRPQHLKMAELSLDGYIVAQPDNYNERVYQVCIINKMKLEPETIVIGSSRGFFIGSEITGFHSIYNNCVSGACLEDYYGLLGLYFNKFHTLPKRIIIETSPWVFYKENPEGRWLEAGDYNQSACMFYRYINDKDIPISKSIYSENPYISLPYFRYNINQFVKNGFHLPEEEAHISMDESEAADYPDGTIRYNAALENESLERLQGVQSTSGACNYQNSNLMIEVDEKKADAYEKMIDYLKNNGSEVIIYLQPFSVTQCKYIFDHNLNPGFILAEEYIKRLASEKEIPVYGSYDARDWGLTDNRFIDYMHPDKLGTSIVWNNSKK